MWRSAAEEMPDEYVSVLGHMAGMEPYPTVRECYRVGGKFFFPALLETHEVDFWMEMPTYGRDEG